MRRIFSRNAKLALSALPIAIGCALAQQGDPPLPVPDPNGEGGEATGGTSTGGTGTGGTGTGGASGSSSGTSGSGTTGGASGSSMTGGVSGSAMTGGSGGSAMTGGSAGKGGTAGTGGTAGSAGKGGTAGTGPGGSGGASAGSAGKGGTAGTGGKAGSGGGGAGGPPGGMELFRDNFEMGASAWSPTGTWAIATDGSMVYASSGASASSTWRAAAAGDTAWTDVQIDARVKITSFAGMSTSYYGGICARYTSNSSYACFALRSDGKIAFRVNGNNTASTTPPGGDIQPGTWYNVRVVARGANITAFLNNTEIAVGSRVTSGAPATGRLAFACPGTNMVFDDVVVTTP